jgi:single-stranded-DNA-specific exonuclease
MRSTPTPEALEEGRALLEEALARGPVAIGADEEIESLCGAVLVEAAVQRRGGRAEVLVAGRDDDLAGEPFRARLAGVQPSALVLLGGGARRAAPLFPDLPALIVDSARVAYELVGTWADVEDLTWLAADGAPPRHAAGDLVETAALLNGARRAGEFSGEVTLEILRAARSAADLAAGAAPGSEILHGWRDEVNAEVERCTRTAPRIHARVALVQFTSTAQIHDVVASRWIRRLKGMIVIAANDGALPGRVQFAVRSSDTRLDLGKFVRGLGAASGGEVVARQRRAAGGTLPRAEFDRLIESLGLAATATRPLPRTRAGASRSSPPPARSSSPPFGAKRTGSSR